MNDLEFTAKLEKYGQREFADIFKSKSEGQKRAMLDQAELIDFTMLEGASCEVQEKKRGVISPIATLTMEEYASKTGYYRQIGLEAIRKGKVGAIVLAGGMGTRLGYDHAKGMYDIGLTRKVYIFERQIENMLEVVREAGCFFPLYVMTSHLNDAEIRDFFAEHNYFGYDGSYVHFYIQDMAPCLDDNGKMFLSGEAEIAMSPNGNGGFYSSLLNSEAGEQLRSSSVEFLNVFAVDNVLQKIVDPVFVGAVIDSGCATGAKVVKKCSPDERVGAICLEDGTPSVVEYYEMTDELKAAKLEDGTPAYNYGVILNYLFRLKDIDKVVRETLPVHMVRKKVPYYGPDENSAETDAGNRPMMVHEPEKPNAYKLETLSLDLVHLTDSCLSFEVEREKEFAPIKNAVGVDSVESARELLRKNGIML